MQAEVFEDINSLVENIRASTIPEIYKLELVQALESCESSWRYQFEDFEISNVKNEKEFITSGGFKSVYKGTLKMKKIGGIDEAT